MSEKPTRSLTPRRRAENSRNSRELGDKNILDLGPENKGLAARLLTFTRLLSPKLAARILKGAGFDIEVTGHGDLPADKED